MRLLADESLEARIVEYLRNQGHDVLSIAENVPAVTDTAVLELANREQRILLTNDKDFGELAFRQGKAGVGIVLIRMQSESLDLKISRVAYLLESRGASLTGSFAVVSENQVRIRPLNPEVEFSRKRSALQISISEMLQTLIQAKGFQQEAIGTQLDALLGPLQPDTLAGQEIRIFHQWRHPDASTTDKIEVTIGPDPKWAPIVTISATGSEIKSFVVSGSVSEAMPQIRQFIIQCLEKTP